MAEVTSRGHRKGRTRYGICPTCKYVRHLLAGGGMGAHQRMTPSGYRIGPCRGQGQLPSEEVDAPTNHAYLRRRDTDAGDQ